MKIKTEIKAGNCYPGYPTNWRWALVDNRWICTCTTDYGCQAPLMTAASSAAAPPGQ